MGVLKIPVVPQKSEPHRSTDTRLSAGIAVLFMQQEFITDYLRKKGRLRHAAFCKGMVC